MPLEHKEQGPERALIIASPHIDRILLGEKTWEMRSRRCTIRGLVGLIRKASGHVVGVVEIVGTKGPMDKDELIAQEDKHRITQDRLSDPKTAKWNVAWILEHARPLPSPIPYEHPSGAQSWVKLNDSVRAAIMKQLQIT